MRGLKFRACISPKTIITFTLQDLADPIRCNMFSFRELLLPWLRAGNKPDEYIGRTDKKGGEIYEGDTVHYNYDGTYPDNWEVVWGYDQWILKRGERITGDMNCGDDPHYNDWEETEIIGNIHET